MVMRDPSSQTEPLRTKDVDAAVAMDSENQSRLLPGRHPVRELLPAPFTDVLGRSDIKRIDGVEAPICSLADLVAMKRATNRGSDELDLERLREAHGELPGDPPSAGSR